MAKTLLKDYVDNGKKLYQELSDSNNTPLTITKLKAKTFLFIDTYFDNLGYYLSIFESLQENYNQIIVHVGYTHALDIINYIETNMGFSTANIYPKTKTADSITKSIQIALNSNKSIDELLKLQQSINDNIPTAIKGSTLSKLLEDIFKTEQERKVIATSSSSSSVSSSASSSSVTSDATSSDSKAKSNSSATATKHCNNCNKSAEEVTSKKLLVCSRCKQVNYCCRECQRADWKTHKLNCKKIEEKS